VRTEIYRRLKRCLAEERLAALATVIEGPGAGSQLLLEPGGETIGELGSEALEAAAREAAEAVLRSFGTERRSVETERGKVELFVEAHAPAPKLVLVGAVHTAVHLVTFAKELGYRTFVVDPRSVFASPERFGHADELLREWPQEALPKIGLTEATCLAVLSHDEKFDVPALALALRSPARYLGALGSKKTHARRLGTLRSEGFTDEELARIHAPIGLDLGGRRPEEIALAVMAEIVAVGHGR
jgi:xanthine dehydrogenase accessory factor